MTINADNDICYGNELAGFSEIPLMDFIDVRRMLANESPFESEGMISFRISSSCRAASSSASLVRYDRTRIERRPST